jgi:hypothetical protein
MKVSIKIEIFDILEREKSKVVKAMLYDRVSIVDFVISFD